MIQTIEAVIDERGEIRFLKPIQLPPGRKVLVTILEEATSPKANETALLSEAAFSDWNRPEEEEAWAEFQ